MDALSVCGGCGIVTFFGCGAFCVSQLKPRITENVVISHSLPEIRFFGLHFCRIGVARISAAGYTLFLPHKLMAFLVIVLNIQTTLLN